MYRPKVQKIIDKLEKIQSFKPQELIYKRIDEIGTQFWKDYKKSKKVDNLPYISQNFETQKKRGFPLSLIKTGNILGYTKNFHLTKEVQENNNIQYLNFKSSDIETFSVEKGVQLKRLYFEDCKNLKSITLYDDTLIQDGDYVYCPFLKNCKSLNKFDIPKSVTYIPYECFRDSGIQNIYFHENIKYISPGFLFGLNDFSTPGQRTINIKFHNSLRNVIGGLKMFFADGDGRNYQRITEQNHIYNFINFKPELFKKKDFEVFYLLNVGIFLVDNSEDKFAEIIKKVIESYTFSTLSNRGYQRGFNNLTLTIKNSLDPMWQGFNLKIQDKLVLNFENIKEISYIYVGSDYGSPRYLVFNGNATQRINDNICRYNSKMQELDLNLPNLEYIGFNCFSKTKIKEVRLPSKVKYVGGYSFAGATVYAPKDCKFGNPVKCKVIRY